MQSVLIREVYNQQPRSFQLKKPFSKSQISQLSANLAWARKLLSSLLNVHCMADTILDPRDMEVSTLQ